MVLCYHVLTCQPSACSQLKKAFADTDNTQAALIRFHFLLSLFLDLKHRIGERTIEDLHTSIHFHQQNDKSTLFHLGHGQLCESISRITSVVYGMKVVLDKFDPIA